MILQKEEQVISFSNDAIPTLKKTHFLKPLFDTIHIQTLPKPSLPFSSNPNILHNLKQNVTFKCRKRSRNAWKRWVHNLQLTHQTIWEKAGIFDAITASPCNINLDVSFLFNLAQKWYPETNTFIFPWGECTITLEDVMVLGGFSVIGDSLSSKFEDEEMETKMATYCAEIKRKCYGHLHPSGWFNYFQGKGNELEHVGLLVMWLSRYVLSTATDIDSNVFGIAFRLANGTRIALASAVLASIYRDLTLLKCKIVALNTENGDEELELILWSPLHLVQVWAWERFPTLSPKPVCLVHGKPRISRWHNVHKLQIDSLGFDDNYVEELFLWRPCGLYLKNWDAPKFYSDREMWVVVNSEVDEDYLSFAKFLGVCELEGVDCVEQYLPHRVAMQFGLDQGIPDIVPIKTTANFNLARRSYMTYNNTLDGLECYVPPRLAEGDITVRYLQWWTGAFTSCNEALIDKQSQGTQPRKFKVLFKSMRPQLYSRNCNDIYKGKLASRENTGTQTKPNLVTEIARDLDNGIGEGRAGEHISTEVVKSDGCNAALDDRTHNFEVINTQSSSTMEFIADSGEKLHQESESDNLTNVFVDASKPHNPDNANLNKVISSLDDAHKHEEVAKVSESVHGGLGNKRQKVLHCSSSPHDLLPDFGFEANGEQLHNQISSSLEDLCSENPLNVVHESEKANVLSGKSTPIESMASPSPVNGVTENASLDISIVPEQLHNQNSPSLQDLSFENPSSVVHESEKANVLTGKSTPVESMASSSPVNGVTDNASLDVSIVLENKIEDGRTSENIPVEVNEVDGYNVITDEINKSLESNGHYSSSLNVVNDAVIGKELLQWPKAEISCKEKSPCQESQPSENRQTIVLNEVEQVTVMSPLINPKVEKGIASKFENNATIIDVDEMSDQDDSFEALCKELEDRISTLEAKFFKLMEDKFGF